MKGLETEIKKIAEKLMETEGKRRRVAELLKSMDAGVKLFHICGSHGLKNEKIAAIDGGLVKKSFHGIDSLLVRTACACFFYNNGKIRKVEYFPSKSPTPVPHIQESLSDIDWAYFTSVIRQKAEVETAIECLNRFEPDMLLMDGQIVPHHSEKPSASSPVFPAFQELVNSCKCLHRDVEKRGVLFAGIVEDSRSNRFCGIVRDVVVVLARDSAMENSDVLEKSRDTPFLSLLLDKNERTLVFSLAKNPAEHPVLKDFENANSFYSFYLRTAAFDRPVRVDFIKSGELGAYPDSLASLLLAISGQNPHYGFPSPLIEADNVAKLPEEEMENFYYRLLRHIGNTPSIMRLRREERPF